MDFTRCMADLAIVVLRIFALEDLTPSLYRSHSGSTSQDPAHLPSLYKKLGPMGQLSLILLNLKTRLGSKMLEEGIQDSGIPN